MAELAAAVAKNEETARIMAETARQLASMSESTQVILAKINEIGRRLEAVEEAAAAKAAREAAAPRPAVAAPRPAVARSAVAAAGAGGPGHVLPPAPIPRSRVPPLILTAEQEAERNAMLEAAFSGAHGIKFGGARTRRLKQRRNRKTKYRR
jgi:hypothetical protein